MYLNYETEPYEKVKLYYLCELIILVMGNWMTSRNLRQFEPLHLQIVTLLVSMLLYFHHKLFYLIYLLPTPMTVHVVYGRHIGSNQRNYYEKAARRSTYMHKQFIGMIISG